MASQSEVSFGARLLRAKELLSYIGNFNNFSPPRSEETPAAMAALITQIDAGNSTRAAAQQAYKAAVSIRQENFRTKDVSVFKLLAPLRGAVAAQYGNKSNEFNQVADLIRKIRASRLVVSQSSTNANPVYISQSEQSFGSTTLYFKDLVDVVGQLPNFAPSNPNVSVRQLQQFSAGLDQLNANVANSFQQLQNARDGRHLLYDELSERVTRIKAYVKSAYGTQSREYNLIKGLKI